MEEARFREKGEKALQAEGGAHREDPRQVCGHCGELGASQMQRTLRCVQRAPEATGVDAAVGVGATHWVSRPPVQLGHPPVS